REKDPSVGAPSPSPPQSGRRRAVPFARIAPPEAGDDGEPSSSKRPPRGAPPWRLKAIPPGSRSTISRGQPKSFRAGRSRRPATALPASGSAGNSLRTTGSGPSPRSTLPSHRPSRNTPLRAASPVGEESPLWARTVAIAVRARAVARRRRGGGFISVPAQDRETPGDAPPRSVYDRE